MLFSERYLGGWLYNISKYYYCENWPSAEKSLRKSQEKIVLTALNYSLHLLLSSSKEALFKNFLGTTTC